MPPTMLQSDTPYCSNCHFNLTGCVDSSKCPECGKPLVDVLTRRHPASESGKRFRSQAKVFGLPFLDIALGPKHGEMRGKARGFIAIGDQAMGWVAIGGMARGFVAIGGLAVGVFSLGGLGAGVLAAVGGLALGGFAGGGGAIGVVANGGGALGVVAQGGGAVGYFARAGAPVGVHTISMGAGASSPEAARVFDAMSWFFGAWPLNSLSSLQPAALLGFVTLMVAALIACVGWMARR